MHTLQGEGFSERMYEKSKLRNKSKVPLFTLGLHYNSAHTLTYYIPLILYNGLGIHFPAYLCTCAHCLYACEGRTSHRLYDNVWH